jgi:thiamine biosynthesis lipoprotein
MAVSIHRRDLIRQFASIGVFGSWCLRSDGRSAPIAIIEDDIGYRVAIPSMGSLIEIRWMGGERAKEQRVVDAASQCADMWVDVLSDYQQDSECMRLCRAASGGTWVAVSDSLWRVLLECDAWYRITEGAFDAALGALTQLRRSSKDVPETAWQEARARCGWDHIELDRAERRVRFHRPGVMLDFGAIGKGFVVDRIGEELRGIGIDAFVVNASGNMVVGKPIHSSEGHDETIGWPVAIGVLGHSEREFKRLRLSDCGIATSGDQYQRFRDGNSTGAATRKSHIVDPLQRRGLEQSNMATVITATASDADALATASDADALATACCVHLQRGTLNSWLSRARGELPRAEYVLQSWRDGAIAYTAIPCDW